MKKYFILLVLVLGAATLTHAQTKVKLAYIANYVGDSVEVCGVVSGGIYLQSSQNSPTLINVGGQYPNQLLTVVIFGTYRSLFTTPETSWLNKEICIKGKVELYREKPQIVVRNTNQVVVSE